MPALSIAAITNMCRYPVIPTVNDTSRDTRKLNPTTARYSGKCNCTHEPGTLPRIGYFWTIGP